ncbi:MAG: DNA translocase FtsK [Defluviitaleaceae bacterium]|nr:DNA translocase FtsK [Defluviitaleaceae bacterium]
MPKKTSKPASPGRNLGEARPKSPALYREVKCIGVTVIGILLLLSVFWPNALGRVGGFIHDFALGIFGFGAFVLPIALIAGAVSVLVMRPIRFPWVLSVGLFWSVLSLLHIFNRPGELELYNVSGGFDRIGQIYAGHIGGHRVGGGIFGLLLGDMLYFVIGHVGSIIVLFAAILILTVLLTGRSFVYVMRRGYYESKDALARRRERLARERAEEAENEARAMRALPMRGDKDKDLSLIEYDDEAFDEPEDMPDLLLLQEEREEITKPKPPLFARIKPPVHPGSERPKGAEIVLFPEKKPPEPPEPSPEEDESEIALHGMVDGAAREDMPPWEEEPEDIFGDDPFGDDPFEEDTASSIPDFPARKPKQVLPMPVDISYEHYQLPPLELLARHEAPENATETRTQILKNSRTLEETLRSFKVEAKVVAVSVGPTVTRYDLSPGPGVKVSSIANLSNDLALSLAAQGIRIEAPIPGKSAVGIEIPNKEPQPVFLREILENEKFAAFPSRLAFAVGKDIAGESVVADIARMPHLLIAGATGSGKSVCINTLITSILYTARPDEVKLLMIDPKVVELSVYNGIPHLLIPVVTEPKKASGALSWAVAEMDNRYNLFAETGCRDLKGYNRARVEDGEPPLPQIVIIIDELADLMMVAKGEVEESICRLAQKARAAGLHLIVATQRPSVDVITGLIKANIPSRLAFAVSSGTDSRTVLDMYGAEKLLGKGDMLFLPMGQNKPIRVQGGFISDKEVEGIVHFLKAQAPAEHSTEMIEQVTSPAARLATGGELDEFFHEAVEFILSKGKASTSVLQRQFRIGYNRASRLMEDLEKRGIVGPEDGVKPRKVLITRSEYMEVYGGD